MECCMMLFSEERSPELLSATFYKAAILCKPTKSIASDLKGEIAVTHNYVAFQEFQYQFDQSL